MNDEREERRREGAEALERLRRDAIEELHGEMCHCGYSAEACHSNHHDFAEYSALADAACGPLRDELDRVVAERDEARQQAARYLEGAEYERERASSEARCADERGDLFRQMRTERDMERGRRATAETERDTARALFEAEANRNRAVMADTQYALWLHAEAVWQRDQLKIEADHQWKTRQEIGRRMLDMDTELTEKVDLGRWLLAEAAWQRGEAARSARDSAAYAELGWTATEQLRVALSTERESRFRWAEEAARLQAEVDRAFVFPHDWQEQIATEGTSCCGDSEAVIELLTNWRVDQFRKDAQKEPSDAQ